MSLFSYKIAPSWFSIVATIALGCLISSYFFDFMQIQNDTEGYLNALRIGLGQSDDVDRLHRLNKPLALLIPALLHLTLDISLLKCLLIQQILAYFGAAFFVFLTYELLFQNRDKAYLALVAFLGCQPLTVYGLAALTDSLGWCYSCIGLYACVRLFQQKEVSATNLFLIGAFIAVGFFIKESVVVVGIWLFFSILIYSISLRHILKQYASSGLGFLLVLALGNFLIYQYHQKHFWDWLQFAHTDPPKFSILGYLQQTYRCLDVYWLLVLMGLYSFFRSSASKEARICFWSGLSCLCLLPLVWPYYNDRILFLVAPVLIYWVVRGLDYLASARLLLVLMGGFINISTAYLIYRYQIEGLIVLLLSLYGLLIVSFYRFWKIRLSK